VSFDGVGGRLGMGGGFYDRYFVDANTRPRMIGVAYGVQESLEPLPTQPWDIPLDGVVTESGYRIFDRAPSQQH
jgi:5-formyltetrahydrofolate cyclo-ligase